MRKGLPLEQLGTSLQLLSIGYLPKYRRLAIIPINEHLIYEHGTFKCPN